MRRKWIRNKKLIDKASKARFRLNLAKEYLEQVYDPVEIHLDPYLSQQEKEVKKIKKLLNDRKAFHLYK